MGAGASTEGGGFGAESGFDTLGDGDSPEHTITADEGYDSDLAGDLKDLFSARVKPPRGEPTVDCSGGRLSADPSVGGAANALPCAGDIVAPSQYPTAHPKDAERCPEDTLKLEFVHGYRAHDTRGNLAYDKFGKLCYHAAALGVAMHPGTRKQTFFKGHTDDVMCLAMHPGGELVATGEVGAKPCVHVWRVTDGVRVATIDDAHVVAVTSLAFSADGKYLASVGADAEHTVAVHEWAAKPSATLGGAFGGHLVAKESFGRANVYVAAFNPVDGRLAVGGHKSLKFFSLDVDGGGGGGALHARAAQYSHGARKGFAQCSVLSLAFLPDGCTFGGTANGDVYKYEEGGVRAVRKFPALHHGPVHDMAFTGKAIVTGGKDGKVKLWSVFMQPLFEVNVAKVAEGMLDDHSAPRSYASGKAPSIRALAPSADGRKLAVGTASSEIFEIDVSSETAAMDPSRQGTVTFTFTFTRQHVFARL